MTQLKDTLEIGTHPAETVASQQIGKPKPDSAHSRSDAVSLEVPVKVHGSRVTEASRGTVPRTEPFEEQTTTMIVFPQGGVLRMTTAVVAGQAVVLTNLRSQQDAICRILKVRAYSATQSYVEVEFTNRQPGYWGVFFPSDGADAPRSAAPAASSAMPEVAVHIPANAERPAPEISMLPVASPRPIEHSEEPAPVRPASVPQSKLPESHFVSIGSHEEVQPAASATIAAHPDPLVESDKKARFTDTSKKNAPIAAPVAPSPSPISSASLSMAELRGDTHPAPSMPIPSSAAPMHSESAAPTVLDGAPAEHHERIGSASKHASQEVFGVRLDSSIGVPAGNEGSRGTNWILIGAAAALALALAGGGLYYFSTRSAKSAANSMDAASTQFSNGNSNTTAATQPANPSAGSVAAPVEESRAAANPSAVSDAPAPSEPASRTRIAPSAPAVRSSRTSSVVTEAPQPSAPERPAASSSLPSTFGALNARPVTSANRNTDVGAAPSLDAGAAPSVDGALGTIAAAPALDVPAPAKPAPAGPVRVGGNVKPPQIISSTLPDYPSIARSAGIEGNVVIRVVIDKTGKVADEHAISGPQMLRQPALDAVRRWRYEPSLLDGQPISVEMVVTIQFHR